MNTNKGLIGVIVPVYKVEKYIAECIESILAQTYTNFRLILVDDGTPDNAGKICDEYAKKDPRITVIHQENAGVTRARARGVEEAEDCEWIAFVDSDDTITTDYLKVLHNAVCENIDIVLNEINLKTNKLSTFRYRSQLIGGNCLINIGPCNKLFRKKLFNTHIFDIPRNIVVGEDMIMNIRLAFSSKKEYVSILNKPEIYYYRPNESSITHCFSSTPEYEHLFQLHLSVSIPYEEKDKYFKLTIKNRLANFSRFWGYKYYVKGMKETTFYQELKKDIKTYKYDLSAIDKIIFYCENRLFRFLAINIKKARNYLLQKLATPAK